MSSNENMPAPGDAAPVALSPGEPAGDISTLPDWAQAHVAAVTRSAQTWQAQYEKAAPLAQRAAELEEAGKSELQRAQEELMRFRTEAETATDALARLRVARAAGLADEFAERLVGTAPEDLAADAARLAALITPQANTPETVPRRPVEALTPGDRIEPDAVDITDLGVLGKRMFT
ncbi:hypothetical protein NLX83_21515 [Allokutzneria sp. A3M-2-11 16]|uniref:hypothetical protein n=1 Tax=Allokutzneria sp. A3M-2-11 16 TaxID=2962043 RepID=UPI0020B6AC8E|nr:hypothetical protein [Allokutzneria sp. A3M-2-11 16]MCP3801848.1 hypothetical protein [Allokutzneria sp. A3M-2-11 16]